jgi:formamidopyrimidine-DNA glycosylase
MPEGPEVKTIVRQMNKNIAGKKITGLIFAHDTENLFDNVTKKEFIRAVKNQKVEKVHRVGKYIDIELADGQHIIMHLLITGRLSLINEGDNLPKYFRFAVKFEGKKLLCLGDMRKWTKITLLTKDERKEFDHFKKLGIDIFSDKFSKEKFSEILDSTQNIYTLLLDQKKISGLGNIYVNEVLFTAGVHPKTKSKSIPKNRAEDLYDATLKVAELALKEKGTTIFPLMERNKGSVGWHTLDGEHGNYWKHVKIFQHEGEPCPNCSTTIERVKIGGRSAFFCSVCQPENTQLKML